MTQAVTPEFSGSLKKLFSLGEFSQLRTSLGKQADASMDLPVLVLSAGTCGQASGANEISRAAKRYILENDLGSRLQFRTTGCQGFCEMDPVIVVEPFGHVYPKLKVSDVPAVIKAALQGEVNEKLIFRSEKAGRVCTTEKEIPFFAKQTRIILSRNQFLDPIRIHQYIEQGGYTALEKVLKKNDPDWIVKEVKASGIRGRGGAGFPTGVKWEKARANGRPGEQKYVVCNCDEGDPGAYMDRSILEGNPHSVIEGMLIAGIAMGATRGFIYVRSEYPLAVKHAVIAARQARDIGFLGSDIMGSGVDFDLEIVRGAGAFVCGEETALIRSIEGFAGEPRQRPPYPIEKGIHGHPTCINNVETLANIPVIINMGAGEFAKIGRPGNTGTKIFSVVGKIKNTGLVEVPLGMTIREVIYDICGGPVDGGKIKAVQTGGPSGGCIPERMFDLPIDYDSLQQAGAIMGSGGMIVMDEHTCIVDVAKYFMGFLKDESCGKCYTCRKGTQRMYEILEDITEGKGTMESLSLLRELAPVVRDTSMCGLGQSAPNPVLSSLRYFEEEYIEHIRDGKCRAGACKALVTYSIRQDTCNGCRACVQVCPNGCITGKVKEAHQLDADHCIKCGACFDTCKFDAIERH